MGQKCGGHYYNTEAYTGTIEGSLRVKQAELETNLREVQRFTITEKALSLTKVATSTFFHIQEFI